MKKCIKYSGLTALSLVPSVLLADGGGSTPVNDLMGGLSAITTGALSLLAVSVTIVLVSIAIRYVRKAAR